MQSQILPVFMGDSTFEGRLAPTDRRKVDVTLLTQIATVI